MLIPITGYSFETKHMTHKTTHGDIINVTVKTDCEKKRFAFVKVWKIWNNKESIAPLNEMDKKWRDVKETYLDVCPKQEISKLDSSKNQKPTKITQKI